MTEAGLNTINLSTLNTFQQFILFLLIIIGSAIWVSIGVVHVRKKAFERKFSSIVEEARQRRKDRGLSRSKLSFRKSASQSNVGTGEPQVDGVVVRGRPIRSANHDSATSTNSDRDHPIELPEVGSSCHRSSTQAVEPADQESHAEDLEAGNAAAEGRHSTQHLHVDTGLTRRITFAEPSSPTRQREHGRLLSMQGVGARQDIRNHPTKVPPPIYPADLPKIDESDEDPGPQGYNFLHTLLSGKYRGRNSQFSGLTLQEREKLGGVEYRAVTILSVIVPLYFFLWQALGCVGLGAWVTRHGMAATQVNAENPW